jgi:peptidoglycan/xylan/chitin deacetylase (PgdA/CDA1 family)
MYHEIVEGEPQEVHAVSVHRFADQMAWLRNAGYRVVSLADGLTVCKSTPTSDTVAITFDDGYQDNYTIALPLLLEHQFPATIFLVTGCMGVTSAWRTGRLSLSPMLTWPQAREMAALGVTFGSHTLTHPDLTGLDANAARQELVASRQQIEDALGCRAEIFAYPYSRLNARVKDLVRESGYRLACTYRPNYVGPAGRNCLELERIGILADDTLDDFRQKLRGDLRRRAAWYGQLGRDWLRCFLQARKRGA